MITTSTSGMCSLISSIISGCLSSLYRCGQTKMLSRSCGFGIDNGDVGDGNGDGEGGLEYYGGVVVKVSVGG